LIVADVNLIAYLLIDGPSTSAARDALRRDDAWIAPPLWRSEFVNVFATNVRENQFSIDQAMAKLAAADMLVQTSRTSIADRDVIEVSVTSRIATYDCSYVWLARRLGLKLITGDKAILRLFADIAVSIEVFASGKDGGTAP
jgi:predicted nucleic acid-binding protein